MTENSKKSKFPKRPLLLTISICASLVAALTGCTTTRTADGLDSSLADHSHAYKIAHTMGILDVKDQQAPQGQAITASFPIGDLMASTLIHKGAALGLPSSTFGSFGLEAGLSVGSWLFAPDPEEAVTQAMMFEPVDKFKTGTEAALHAGGELHKKLVEATRKAGFDPLLIDRYTVWPNTWMARTAWTVKIENEKMGCPKTDDYKRSCYVQIWIDDKYFPGEPKHLPQFFVKDELRDRWVTNRYKIEFTVPDGVKTDAFSSKVLGNLAIDLPKESYLYVAPIKEGDKWTAPYVSDGKNIHFFVVQK